MSTFFSKHILLQLHASHINTMLSVTVMFVHRLSFSDVAAATTPVHYIVNCSGLETNLLSCEINDNVALYQSSPTSYIHIDDVFVVCRLRSVYSRKFNSFHCIKKICPSLTIDQSVAFSLH